MTRVRQDEENIESSEVTEEMRWPKVDSRYVSELFISDSWTSRKLILMVLLKQTYGAYYFCCCHCGLGSRKWFTKEGVTEQTRRVLPVSLLFRRDGSVSTDTSPPTTLDGLK